MVTFDLLGNIDRRQCALAAQRVDVELEGEGAKMGGMFRQGIFRQFSEAEPVLKVLELLLAANNRLLEDDALRRKSQSHVKHRLKDAETTLQMFFARLTLSRARKAVKKMVRSFSHRGTAGHY